MTDVVTIPASVFTPIIQLVADGLNSRHSRRAYEHALNDFLLWYQNQRIDKLSRAVVLRYVAYLRDDVDLSPANINLRLSAIRRLVREASMNELLTEQTALAIERIEGVRQSGHTSGNWLTKAQATELVNAPDLKRGKGIRDRAILALLVGAGTRREELTTITVGHFQQRDGRWAIVDVSGKGNKIRTIPIAAWTKVAVDAWLVHAQITDGVVFRAMHKGGAMYDRAISVQSVMDIVHEYGAMIGVESLAPHDLRRTFAKLAYKGGSTIDQIALSLGHESIETTQRYLGLEQSFEDAPADHLGIQLAA